MPRAFFEAVDDALRSFLPPKLRDYTSVRSGHNVKVWFEEPKEHYEVQFVSAAIAGRKGSKAPSLEIGFHAEHGSADANDDVLASLSESSARWRKTLGDAPEAEAFLGYQKKVWRRLSELWHDADPNDADIAVEAAARLCEYIVALEAARTSATRRATSPTI